MFNGRSIEANTPLTTIDYHNEVGAQLLIKTFLQQTNLFTSITGAAEKFVKTFQETKQPENALAPIFVVLDFQYKDLVVHSLELLHFVIEEPVHFKETVKYYVYGVIREFVHNRSENRLTTIDIAQIHVRGRFIGLPLQRNLLYEPSSHLLRFGLSLINGILSAYTNPVSLVVQSIWYCNTGCRRNVIQRKSKEAPLCTSCSRPMCEYQKLRTTEYFRILTILPSGSVVPSKNRNKLNRIVTVRLPDHKYDCELKLGEQYLITGHINTSSSDSFMFEAWNLMRQ